MMIKLTHNLPASQQRLTGRSIGKAIAAIGVLLSLDLLLFTTMAEAGCRPTGRYVHGLPILACTGRTRCRPTGRYKYAGGKRYPILRCPR